MPFFLTGTLFSLSLHRSLYTLEVEPPNANIFSQRNNIAHRYCVGYCRRSPASAASGDAAIRRCAIPLEYFSASSSISSYATRTNGGRASACPGISWRSAVWDYFRRNFERTITHCCAATIRGEME